MLLKYLTSLCALSATAFANDPFTSLGELLDNVPTLSQYNKYFKNSSVYQKFSGAQNVTVFAFSDSAVQAASNSYKASLLQNKDIIRSLIEYSCVQGVHHSSTFAAVGLFLQTYQADTYWGNVTGGQVLEVISKNGNASVFHADRMSANVVISDIPFNGGLVHIVDQILEIPHNATLSAANLNVASIPALDKAGVMAQYQAQADITIFALSNLAFQSLGPMDATQLNQMLQSYILPKAITFNYAFLAQGLTLKSINGTPITLKMDADGTLYVNNAIVEIQDIITNNGAMFVIDR
ncbi:MAG: hypothetical protein M1814_000666 [Vezdaea aestivalis]|nr:MAG: hypothetical protein M1814_000666 [Vezdaea aestivalis]